MLWRDCVPPSVIPRLDPGVGVPLVPFVTLGDVLGDSRPLTPNLETRSIKGAHFEVRPAAVTSHQL